MADEVVAASDLVGSAGPGLQRPPTTRLPSLDGWRGFGMLHVLATHSTIVPGFPLGLLPFVHWLVDGELGVRTFFLLSGFLITRLLIVEVETSGRISLSRFYLRRALRILPVYVAFLAVLAWLDIFTPYRQTTDAWIGNLTFTTNFVLFSKLNWTCGHLWSLAVEEQFYLVWPVLFWLCGVAKDRPASWWLLAVPLVVAPPWRYLTWMTAAPQSMPHLFQGFSTFNFFDWIAMGCLCGLLYAREQDRLGRLLTARPVVTAVTGALLILIPHVLTRAMLLRIVTTPFGHTMQALGVGILVLQSVFMPATGFYRILNWPILSGLGVMSYSIYIWQQIFSTRPLLLGQRHEWWNSFPGWLVPVLAVGLVSYFVLERPFIRLRARLRHRSTVASGRQLGHCLSAMLVVSFGAPVLLAQHGHGSEGVGKAHMATSCAPAVHARFDRALAVLHNFWYARALTQFQEIQKADPECAMAYWGAAMTYNHPFWDAPSPEDEAAAWAYVQQGLKARSKNHRERMYLDAVAALYKDAGAGTKQSRDDAYREQMAATHAKYPDDETTLFYGLSVLSTIKEGTKGFEMQGRAVALFESVYAHDRQHPGALHYLIHAYDDPVHAAMGLTVARAYAKAAAAVPHAYHMPSHIFTRLGYWDEAAATNENAWRISDDDVTAAGESGALRDFHALNYLSYNYLQLGRYRDAKQTVDLFAAQYAAIANRRTVPDSQDLQARHVRGRTIFALPDRVLYGYFDTLARFIVESEAWSEVPNLPLIAPSSDFVVMKLHLEAMAAARRKDVATARAKAAEMMERARVPGQHPFVQQILTIQAREAAASAAVAAGDAVGAVTEMDAAVAIEDAIDSLSQPPYPIVPAHELYGSMLMEMGRPAEARRHFEEALRRTPGRPKAIAGIARAAEAMGDTATARAQYTRLTEMWKSADPDRPELLAARRFLQSPSPVGFR